MQLTINSINALKALTILISICATTATLRCATSITQFGITWTFSEDKQTGRFVNGDYWVVGPVRIIDIQPASRVIDGRATNGTMMNPAAGPGVSQGFDSSMTANKYIPNLNVARPLGNDLSSTNPLTIDTDASLISTISNPEPGHRPQLTDAAVLTILSKAPAAHSFRPPYCGTDKSIIANESNVDFSKLKSLPKPASAPDIATVTDYFKRPWVEINTEYGGREMHPSNNQEDYGRDMAKQLSAGLLSLQLNYSLESKRPLAYYLIQYGIDVYGAAITGGVWKDNGGHNLGRKMPLLLAATILNNAQMLQYADASRHFIFQEDRQTFYISSVEVAVTHSASWDPDKRSGVPESYEASDIGLAEWGITHSKDPNADNRAWNATYRDIASSGAFGHVLTAHIMGLRPEWNWNPVFDYFDRYWLYVRDTRVGTNTPTKFERDMWAMYRGSVSLPQPPSAPRLKVDR